MFRTTQAFVSSAAASAKPVKIPSKPSVPECCVLMLALGSPLAFSPHISSKRLSRNHFQNVECKSFSNPKFLSSLAGCVEWKAGQSVIAPPSRHSVSLEGAAGWRCGIVRVRAEWAHPVFGVRNTSMWQKVRPYARR